MDDQRIEVQLSRRDCRHRRGALGRMRLPRDRGWRTPVRSVHHPPLSRRSGAERVGGLRHRLAASSPRRARWRRDRRGRAALRQGSQPGRIHLRLQLGPRLRAGGRTTTTPSCRSRCRSRRSRGAAFWCVPASRTIGQPALHSGSGAGGGDEQAVVRPRHVLHRGRGAAGRTHGPAAPGDAAISLAQPRTTAASTIFWAPCRRASARRSARNARRRRAFGGEIVSLTGDGILPEHWDAFWRFYQDTGARKWGTPYLTRAFFEQIHDTMRDDVLLILALRDGRPVAGALNFIGRETLYGRYWGAQEHHPCLHFEPATTGDRLRHRARAPHGRGGRAGRAQDRARLSAGADALAALVCR